jgi:hypothetical protein
MDNVLAIMDNKNRANFENPREMVILRAIDDKYSWRPSDDITILQKQLSSEKRVESIVDAFTLMATTFKKTGYVFDSLIKSVEGFYSWSPLTKACVSTKFTSDYIKNHFKYVFDLIPHGSKYSEDNCRLTMDLETVNDVIERFGIPPDAVGDNNKGNEDVIEDVANTSTESIDEEATDYPPPHTLLTMSGENNNMVERTSEEEKSGDDKPCKIQDISIDNITDPTSDDDDDSDSILEENKN